MGIKRKLLPLLASGLLAGLTVVGAECMPQPSAAELQALATMNSIPVQQVGDCRGFLRFWLFGSVAAPADPVTTVAESQQSP